MKIYPEKGHTLTEAERLELGRLLLKAGYVVRMGREKVGSAARWFLEFYHKLEFGQEKTAPSDNDTESGGMRNNYEDSVAQEVRNVKE